MGKDIKIYKTATGMSEGVGCLACGTTENLGTRRYCSIHCRQKLRHNLNLRTGLLKCLNTEYATFYFTDINLILNVLPYGSKEIFSYFFPRSNGKKPVEDFKTLADMLGNEWWIVKRKTNKSYIASRQLLKLARRNNVPIDSVKPMINRIPVVKKKSLVLLKLHKSTIDSTEPLKIIQRAYRLQAKKHHPDTGGNASEFRKIQNAYEELSNWAKNPKFLRRQSFPDKWLYNGVKDRWVQPTRYKGWGS